MNVTNREISKNFYSVLLVCWQLWRLNQLGMNIYCNAQNWNTVETLHCLQQTTTSVIWRKQISISTVLFSSILEFQGCMSPEYVSTHNRIPKYMQFCRPRFAKIFAWLLLSGTRSPCVFVIVDNSTFILPGYISFHDTYKVVFLSRSLLIEC